MTFHGKPEQPEKPRELRHFRYKVYDRGIEHDIQSHEIYFYDHGRVGFWNINDDGDRELVLATNAFQIRQIPAKEEA